MDTVKLCEHCGKPLGPKSVQGLCAECLLKVGLGTGTGAESSGNPAPPSGASRFVPPEPAQLAPHFPQLEILECLGRGGMGVVYKARQPKLNRFVALKILPRGREKDPQFVERFAREARALAQLNHPNIVTVHDFGEAGGQFYLLMEFVDGLSLRQLLRAGKMKPEEALAIVPKICDALQYAHEQGIVHRDIKPENILLDKQGRVKIADFGIARLMGEGTLGVPPSGGAATGQGDRLKPELQTALTDAGKVIGTPQYMAPEQVEQPQTVDHRADIYSLGVVFYEMLTGELPGNRLEPPSRKVQIDVRLDEIVLRALETEPERRYQQASILKTQVETLAMTAVSSARPAGSLPRHWTTWTPFQTPLEREICGHMTPAERNRMGGLLLLFLILGWGGWSYALIAFVDDFQTQLSKGTVGVVYVGFLCLAVWWLALWRRKTQEVMASTCWAKEQGINLEQLQWTWFARKSRAGRFKANGKAFLPAAALLVLLLLIPAIVYRATGPVGWIPSDQGVFNATRQANRRQHGNAHSTLGGRTAGSGSSVPIQQTTTSAMRRRNRGLNGLAPAVEAAADHPGAGSQPASSATRIEANAGRPSVLAPLAAVKDWLRLVDNGDYARSWQTAAASFREAITKAEWVAKLRTVRKPLGKVVSRKFETGRIVTDFPDMPKGPGFLAQFNTSFTGLTAAVETLTFTLEQGRWRAAGYLIQPRTAAEAAAVAAAYSWLAVIDEGHYAQSWQDASAPFRKATTRQQWVAALQRVRKPLGRMLGRLAISARLTTDLPGAPPGDYVVMQFQTSFANQKSATETVTFVRETDAQWRAIGYFLL